MGCCFSSPFNSEHNRKISDSVNQVTAYSRNSNADIGRSVSTTSRQQPAPYRYNSASPASATYKQPSKTEKNSASSVSAISRQPSATVNNSASSVSAISRQASATVNNFASSVSTTSRQASATVNNSASSVSATSRQASKTEKNSASSVSAISRQPSATVNNSASSVSAISRQASATVNNFASSVSTTSRQASATVNNSASSVSATSRQASISQYNYAQPVLKNPKINIIRIQQTEPKRLVDVISPTEKIEEALVAISGIKQQQVLDLILQYMPNVKIADIYEVKNQFLKGMYELKKEEYKSRYQSSPKEKILIHTTAKSKVNNIIKNNFDWRKVIRKKFGAGTSFTHDADYANCHCNRNNGTQRAFIITKVLIYNTQIGNYSTDTVIPPENVDTTVGKRNRQEIVYVKYNDNEFLPIYVAYYESSDEMISNSQYYENNSNYRRRRTTYNY